MGETIDFSGEFDKTATTDSGNVFSESNPLRSEEFTIKVKGVEKTLSFGEVINYLARAYRGGKSLNSEQVEALEEIRSELKLYLERQSDKDSDENVGVSQAIMIVDYLLNSRLADIKKTDPAKSEEYNLTVEVLRSKALPDLIRSWHTNDLDSTGEPRLALEKVIGEKLDELKMKMVTSEDPDEKAEQEKNWENFKKLYMDVYYLIWFGIFNSRSMNKKDLTAKEKELFEAAEVNGALNSNTDFNKNPLVGAENLDREEFGENMGVVQKIVYAAYQEMKKTGRFKRSVAWTTETTTELIDFICEVEDSYGDERHATTGVGRVSDLGIRSELAKFPSEVVEMIKFFAILKLSRDNLGFKAGVWHLGKNKAAFKFSNGGSGKPEGLLASIMYQVGKNSARENHAACLAFIDPIDCELIEDGTKNDAEVLRMEAEIDNYFENWFHPTWDDIVFYKFSPQHWDEDFPGLEDFFNQTESVVGHEDYTKARDAVLKMVELAATAPVITLSTNAQQIETKVRTAVKTFNTEIAKAMAYLGNNNEPEQHHFSKVSEYEEAVRRYERFKPFHELIRAAYQFYLLNLLVAVPGNPALFKTVLNKQRDSEYHILFNTALKTMEDTIEINTSLKGFYHKSVLGGFLRQDAIRRTWRDEPLMRNTFHRWRESSDVYLGYTLINDPATDPKERSVAQRQEMYLETPKMPYSPSDHDGSGWKSPFEAAG